MIIFQQEWYLDSTMYVKLWGLFHEWHDWSNSTQIEIVLTIGFAWHELDVVLQYIVFESKICASINWFISSDLAYNGKQKHKTDLLDVKLIFLTLSRPPLYMSLTSSKSDELVQNRWKDSFICFFSSFLEPLLFWMIWTQRLYF